MFEGSKFPPQKNGDHFDEITPTQSTVAILKVLVGDLLLYFGRFGVFFLFKVLKRNDAGGF